MYKRKSDVLDSIPASKDIKKVKKDLETDDKTNKTVNLLVNSDSDRASEDESDAGGAPLEESGFKINEDYARRFEYNKKREELHKR